MRELYILKKLSHPHIVKHFGAFDKDGEDDNDSDEKEAGAKDANANKDDAEVGLVMEVGQGTVVDLVEAKKGETMCLDVEEVAHLCRHMMNGLAYLHAENIIHRYISKTIQ